MFQLTIFENVKNETSAALVWACMNNEFFHETLRGLKFEGKENSFGGYELIAYHDNLKTLKRMEKKLINTAYILYRAMPMVQNELTIAGLMK